MELYCENLYNRTNETLLDISMSAEGKIDLCRKSFTAVQESLYKLKEYVNEHSFEDKSSEIVFFKSIQPKFLGELIYFAEVFRIESSCPLKPPKQKKGCYRKEMEKISAFYERHQELYWYHFSGKTDLDDKLFLRNGEIDFSFPDIYFLDADPEFSCAGSYRVGQFIAFKKVLEYLQISLDTLEGKKSNKTGPVWTGPKVWLIELIYALKAAGVFNKGKVDIKDIANITGPMFQKDLGEYYRAFQEIRLRKKNRTVFLDHLKTALTEYMDAADGM